MRQSHTSQAHGGIVNQCPKCGCVRIVGPTYESIFGMERLRYRCYQCGYSTTGPTNDQRNEEAARRRLTERGKHE